MPKPAEHLNGQAGATPQRRRRPAAPARVGHRGAPSRRAGIQSRGRGTVLF